MKCGILVVLLITCALPVHAASQGTIEETESAIIVEYTGDAKELPDEKAQTGGMTPAVKTSPAELQAAVPGVDPLVPAKADMSAREARANLNEAQRKKLEAQAATRSARQLKSGSSTRQQRQEDVE